VAPKIEENSEINSKFRERLLTTALCIGAVHSVRTLRRPGNFNPVCQPVAPWQDHDSEEIESSAVSFQEICLQPSFLVCVSKPVIFILTFYDIILF